MTAMKPVNCSDPRESDPPSSSITSATPRPAPLLMPKMEGSARGLRKAVCSSSPLTASAAPLQRAVTACGSRLSSTIYRHDGFSPSPRPSRMSSTSPAGIRIEPSNILRANSPITATSSKVTFFFISNFVDFCHDSANQASLLAFTAPKVHLSSYDNNVEEGDLVCRDAEYE